MLYLILTLNHFIELILKICQLPSISVTRPFSFGLEHTVSNPPALSYQKLNMAVAQCDQPMASVINELVQQGLYLGTDYAMVHRALTLHNERKSRYGVMDRTTSGNCECHPLQSVKIAPQKPCIHTFDLEQRHQ
jgi:hypothetical protein